MNKFQYAEKINANTKLSFANKAIINQIISFQLNDQKFHGTDEYLASTWGVSPRTIQRQIAELKKLNLIQIELDKKKHSTGDKTWYNKRYITVDLSNLSNFLQDDISINDLNPISSDLNNDIQAVEQSVVEDVIMPQMESIEITPTDEPIEVITDDSEEFDYDDEQQEAWFNQMAGITSPQIVIEPKPIVTELKPNSTLTAVRPTHTIEDKKIVAKKLKFKEDFDKGMKYNAGTMNPSDFHYITKNYFRDTDPIIVLDTINKIDKNSFDEFWNRLQQLKLEVIKQ